MEIFGKKIHLRPYVCSPNGGYACDDTRLNFYICASSFCPAKCSFCPGFSSRNKVDFGKLRESLVELHKKEVINRIGITGGEPLADLKNLDKILQTILDVCGESAYHVSINTSGVNLSALRTINHYSVVNDVHISRHSQDDKQNSDIFGVNTPTLKQIRRETELSPGVFSLSCNLLKGHVDNASNLRSYLDTAIEAGVCGVGLVSLMNKTNLCSDLFIDYESITSNLRARDGFLFEEISKDKDSCRCENFTYYNDSGNVSFYMRRVFGNKADCVKSFVFNQDSNLVTNFGKDMVLF